MDVKIFIGASLTCEQLWSTDWVPVGWAAAKQEEEEAEERKAAGHWKWIHACYTHSPSSQLSPKKLKNSSPEKVEKLKREAKRKCELVKKLAVLIHPGLTPLSFLSSLHSFTSLKIEDDVVWAATIFSNFLLIRTLTLLHLDSQSSGFRILLRIVISAML